MHDGVCVKEFFALTCGLKKQPPELFCKKGVLRNFVKFTGKHLRQRLFLIKKSLWHRCFPAQVFSCEFCEISKNTFFIEHLRTTASEFGIL